MAIRGLNDRFGAARRLRAVLLAACVGLAVVATASVARADCTPAAANGVTATCSGTTTNQGAGAPGTSAGVDGYGTGVETGVTINVGAGSTVTSTGSGIYLGDVTVINNMGSSITGAVFGIGTAIGSANVTNYGSITGGANPAIYAATNTTVINNAGASIIGNSGVWGDLGFANVTNSGSITGTAFHGIVARADSIMTNNDGGSITGGRSGIVVQNSSANITNSGSITGGNYGIQFQCCVGASSVFNAGTISGGIAAIQFAGTGNTLTLAPGSAITGNVLGTGSDTFQLGGTGSAMFDMSQIGAAAQYRGFSTFNKIGSSTWTLTDTSTFAGPINVTGGTLIVNGSIASSSMLTVNNGAMLGGVGTLGNTTIASGGILAPGNSIGTISVNGNLTFSAGSIYDVEVLPSASDRTNVTGNAALGGATVNASFAAGTYVAKQYTILNATGGLGGSTFNALVNSNLPSGFKSSLGYDANNAYLDLALAFIAPPNTGLSGNQSGVGNALVSYFNRNGGIPLVYGGLTATALTQASGETATGSQQIAMGVMTQFMGSMTDTFAAGRGGAVPRAMGFADEGNASAYASTAKSRAARDATAMFTKAPLAQAYDPRWSVWASGFGGSQTTDGNTAAGSNTSTSRIYGAAVGADYLISPDTVAGFAMAGGGTSFSVTGGGSGRSDLFQIGGFVRHTIGSTYLSGALAYGWQDVTTNRTVIADQLQARFTANTFSGRFEAGNRTVTSWLGGLGLTPYAAVQVTAIALPAYAETAVAGSNAFALSYAGKTVTDTRSEFGLRTDKSFAVNDAILTLRGRAAWAHDFNTDRSASATFIALPGASFVVNGAAAARDAALTTASAEMTFISGISLAATFEGEFSDVTRSYAGKGVVRYSW